MFFITGGASLLAVLATFFPDSTVWQTVAVQMNHVPWDGLVHHDTIFPLFLFIAGVSYPFSLAKQRERGASNTKIYCKVVRRGLMLVLLGLVCNGLLRFEFDTLRWPSVLARIGLAWMFAAIVYTSLYKRRGIVVAIVPLILVSYWLVSAFVHAPGVAPEIDPLTREGNIACYIDRMLLGAHCYRPDYDPEGILSTVPAICTALLGMLTGSFVRSTVVSPKRKALLLFAAGVAFSLIGWAWNFVYPINKALWSSSFVVAVAGYSLIMFALFYYIIDVRGLHRWDFYFKVIGMNSITVFMAPRFIDFSFMNHRLFDGVYSLFPENLEPLCSTLGYMLVLWMFLYFLYKQKIFLRV